MGLSDTSVYSFMVACSKCRAADIPPECPPRSLSSGSYLIAHNACDPQGGQAAGGDGSSEAFSPAQTNFAFCYSSQFCRASQAHAGRLRHACCCHAGQPATQLSPPDHAGALPCPTSAILDSECASWHCTAADCTMKPALEALWQGVWPAYGLQRISSQVTETQS